MRLAARRPLLVAHVLGAAVGFAVWGQLVIGYTLVGLPASTGYGLGRSVTAAALSQLPGVVVLVVGAPVAARVIRSHGARTALEASCLMIAGGFLLGLVFHDALVQVAVGSAVVFAGIGLAFGAIPVLLDEHVRPEETARSNALSMLSRTAGSALATAVSGTVLASITITVDGHRYPDELAFRLLYGLAAGVAITAVGTARWIGGSTRSRARLGRQGRTTRRPYRRVRS